MRRLFSKDEKSAKADVVHNVLLVIYAIVAICLLIFQGPN